ncbi:MAG: hypothetical protein J1F32_05980 [Erysipelotrichales bacterium]|nr:hypothetical protein [Erysipelotrichales bacterium]
MKILNKIVLLLATSLVLFSCNNKDAIYTPRLDINEQYNASIDYSEYSFDDYSVTITPTQLKTMLDNKESFAFYFHNRYCESCEGIKPLLIHYVLETKNAFYSLDIGNDSNFTEFQIGNLYSQIKDANDYYLFKDEDDQFIFPTPVFYFINNGAIEKKQLVTSNMFNYSFFKKVMNKNLITSTSYIITNFDNLNKYRYVYYCDLSKSYINDLYKEIIACSDISIAINRLSSLEFSESKIVDQTSGRELITSDTTTLTDILSFYNA